MSQSQYSTTVASLSVIFSCRDWSLLMELAALRHLYGSILCGAGKRKHLCHFIPHFNLPQSHCPPPPPSLHLSVSPQSKCIRQPAVTALGVGCLSRVLPHISMTRPPLSPPHTPTSHTSAPSAAETFIEIPTTRADTQALVLSIDERVGKEVEGDSTFHPVIYSSSDTATPQI